MKLFSETVSSEMMGLLKQLMEMEELKPFRLVGGPALALQFGHRTSVDLDLFAGDRTETQSLPKIIHQRFGRSFQLVSQNRNGFVGQINNVKIDIVDWKVPFTHEPLEENGIRMATPNDIFASKCDALLDRKAEKDFSDIAMIASKYDLSNLFVTLRTRYAYITTGAISAFLLNRGLMERDHTIRYLQNYDFEYFANIIQNKIIEFASAIKEKKRIQADDREKKIQSLIEQKRRNQK